MPTEPAYVPDMSPALMTAEELLHASIPGKRVELVRGVLVVREPPGLRHGRVALTLGARMLDHVRAHALGQVEAHLGYRSRASAGSCLPA